MPESTLEIGGQDTGKTPSLAEAILRRSRPPSLSDFRKRELITQLAELGNDKPARRKQQRSHFVVCMAAPAGLISIVIHLSLLIALGVYMLQITRLGAEKITIEVVAVQEEEAEVITELAVDIEPFDELPVVESIQDDLSPDDDEPINEDALVPDAVLHQPGTLQVDLPLDLMLEVIETPNRASFGEVSPQAAGFAARSLLRRQALSHGATPESENAVELALDWLARHQRSDGLLDTAYRRKCLSTDKRLSFTPPTDRRSVRSLPVREH